ncbi:hypothetical protein TTHERM_000586872 (macronuclear) [Tetrahymena thermophila SB210]|uniref:Uncharacterized protein n=1 Tax=Tetrahymena thermophila (strain SB210) TaxID=312017 RepID=W7XIN1_TETTS|nr:hypothetical protein TTHERM_000586872 [Tetrahymena thermophila SB210]EWS73444.1 hypothetical protein TTHERM_000586872 [Tetrahymena thermophila SB210]|eukprot:XP_012654015.1 hypothetical protein TTHERM_000586872 [Tetrahymena thermophila SB210]
MNQFVNRLQTQILDFIIKYFQRAKLQYTPQIKSQLFISLQQLQTIVKQLNKKKAFTVQPKAPSAQLTLLQTGKKLLKLLCDETQIIFVQFLNSAYVQYFIEADFKLLYPPITQRLSYGSSQTKLMSIPLDISTFQQVFIGDKSYLNIINDLSEKQEIISNIILFSIQQLKGKFLIFHICIQNELLYEAFNVNLSFSTLKTEKEYYFQIIRYLLESSLAQIIASSKKELQSQNSSQKSLSNALKQESYKRYELPLKEQITSNAIMLF